MDQIDLTKKTLPELFAFQQNTNDCIAALKVDAAALQLELQRRFAGSVGQALQQKGKEHGSVTLPMQDRLRLKAEVKQEVKWDSAGLMAVAQTLPWERVRQIFKIDFSVSETIYKGIEAAAPELREKIDAARTTSLKPAKIIIEKEAE